MSTRELFEKYEKGEIDFKKFLIELYEEEVDEYLKLYQEIGLLEHMPVDWHVFSKVQRWVENAYLNKKEGKILNYLELLCLARQELELKDVSFGQGGTIGSNTATWNYSAKYKNYMLHIHIDAANGVAVVNMLNYDFDDIETLVFSVNDDITEAYEKETYLNWVIPYVFQILLYEYGRANKDIGIDINSMPDPYIDTFYWLMLRLKEWVDSSND